MTGEPAAARPRDGAISRWLRAIARAHNASIRKSSTAFVATVAALLLVAPNALADVSGWPYGECRYSDPEARLYGPCLPPKPSAPRTPPFPSLPTAPGTTPPLSGVDPTASSVEE